MPLILPWRMPLWDVRPSQTAPNLGNLAWVYPECSGDFGLRLSRASHGLNVAIGKFRVPHLNSRARREPTFPVAIPHVVGWSSEEQVSRVDATRNVALVADEQANRDGAVCYFPSHPMSAARPPLPRQRAVPVLIPFPGPQNAPGRGAFPGMMCKALGKRPVVGVRKSSKRLTSHLPAPFQRRMVRAWMALSTPFKPTSILPTSCDGGY